LKVGFFSPLPPARTGVADYSAALLRALQRSGEVAVHDRGADIALLFREVEKGRVRISLRSCEGVDVSKVAAQFGGGGHRMASGCSYRGTLAQAEEKLVAACIAALG